MIQVKEYDKILQGLDVCSHDGDIGKAIEAEGLPEDLADALLLYAEYQDNRKHWPTWMVSQYERMFSND